MSKHLTPIKVNQIDHHRNGVAGKDFYVVHFTAEGDRMLAVVFPSPDERGDDDWTVYERTRSAAHNPSVAVFEAAKLPDTTFGENSFRGDLYAPALYAAIAEYNQRPYKEAGRLAISK